MRQDREMARIQLEQQQPSASTRAEAAAMRAQIVSFEKATHIERADSDAPPTADCAAHPTTDCNAPVCNAPSAADFSGHPAADFSGHPATDFNGHPAADFSGHPAVNCGPRVAGGAVSPGAAGTPSNVLGCSVPPSMRGEAGDVPPAMGVSSEPLEQRESDRAGEAPQVQAPLNSPTDVDASKMNPDIGSAH